MHAYGGGKKPVPVSAIPLRCSEISGIDSCPPIFSTVTSAGVSTEPLKLLLGDPVCTERRSCIERDVLPTSPVSSSACAAAYAFSALRMLCLLATECSAVQRLGTGPRSWEPYVSVASGDMWPRDRSTSPAVRPGPPEAAAGSRFMRSCALGYNDAYGRPADTLLCVLRTLCTLCRL